MLKQLLISHFALIEKLSLDFEQGFTVLSGETGAGKSIIIDALSLVLGERAETQNVHPQASRADICAIFDIAEQPAIAEWLISHGLDAPELDNNTAELSATSAEMTDNDLPFLSTCILRRSISRDGRSQAFINDHPTTLQQLKILSNKLLTLHGQHQQQALLHGEYQRILLDAFAGTSLLCQEVNTIYRHYQSILTELNTIRTREQTLNAERELLRYQREELLALELLPDEITTLIQQHQQLTHAVDINSACDQIISLADEQIISALYQAQHTLNPLVKLNPALQEAHDLLSQSLILIQEASHSLNHYQQNIDLHPDTLTTLENRLSVLHAMARKHHVSLETLPNFINELNERWQQFAALPEKSQQLEQELAITLEKYSQLAKQLSSQRLSAAQQLAQDVNKHLHELGMTGANFSVQLTPLDLTVPHATGNEQIAFYIQTNPGHPAGLLNKIASGGELSRIALAIDVVTATAHAVPTIIFDEVDTGVSGATAAVIGQLLRKLGRSAQVFSITHLPQVAAQADHHFQIQKHTQHNHVRTEAHLLDEQAHITEIARLLGGLKITAETRSHAQALIKEAQEEII